MSASSQLEGEGENREHCRTATGKTKKEKDAIEKERDYWETEWKKECAMKSCRTKNEKDKRSKDTKHRPSTRPYSNRKKGRLQESTEGSLFAPLLRKRIK